MLKKLVIFFLSLLLQLGYSQSFKFRHITNEEGLSTNYITAILKDSKGLMWFGTQDGLCRYDAYQIKTFKSDILNNTTLSSSDITCLAEGMNGQLIVGTRTEGINIFYPETNYCKRILNQSKKETVLTDQRVTCIEKDGDDIVWIGTANGINKFNYKTETNEKFLFPVEKPVEVRCIYEYNGKVYVGTNGDGLWTLKNNKLVAIEIKNISNSKLDKRGISIIGSIVGYAGSLYLGTYGNGVAMIDAETFEVNRIFKYSDENRNFNYIDKIVIINNQLYCITRDGFLIFDLIKGTKTHLSKDDRNVFSLNDDYLTSIYIDGQKNIWIGTFSGGINVSFSQELKFPKLPTEISDHFVNAFSAAPSNTHKVWIGGEKSIKLLDYENNKVEDYSHIIGGNSHALSILHSSRHQLWVGTWGLGLFKYDLDTKKKKQLLEESMGGTIVSMCEDEFGIIWAGSYGDGLFLIDQEEKVNRFTTENGLSSDNIIGFYIDSKKNVWLATDGGGAMMVKNGEINNPKSIITYSANKSGNSISSNSIYSIIEDKNKRIWFSSNAGISMLDPNTNKFTVYNEKDGLSNDFVFSILEDSTGNLWMSTNKGVSKFNPNMINKNGSAFKNYDKKDGLVNKEFTQGAYCKSKDGYFVFGGIDGINIFHPKEIQDNLHVPPVLIVNYKRFGEDVITDSVISYKKHLKLTWRENYFQFELAALDYNDPNKNKYTYKLEGYDDDWSSPTNIRYVSYNELPGGEYIFKVKASNNDGVWNDTPYEIYITVVPPFWKTTWFYILISVFGVAGVIIFTQLRTRAIKKENKILESKVEERTKELAEKNRDITSSIEYANRIQEAILPARTDIFEKFKDCFILYRPKDIVSGDFYWFGYKNGFKIIAAVDCTGHGVPGAFMSMIGHNVLNQVVMEKGTTDPGQILSKLHLGVQNALKQGRSEIDTNDGMDVSLISVNETNGEVFWAGAFRPLIIVRENGELEKISGNRYSVGGAQLDDTRIFNTHDLHMKSGDLIYLFSDGYADQFGGDIGKKYMLKRFQDELSALYKFDMKSQKAALEKSFEEWKGVHEQVDDVLVIGIRF